VRLFRRKPAGGRAVEPDADRSGGGRSRGRLRRVFRATFLLAILAVVAIPFRRGVRAVARWADARADNFSQPGSGFYARFVAPALGRLYRGVANDVVAELAARGRTRMPSIVDLGCGPGDLSAELHRRLRDARIVGIDLSPSMMQLASRHATADGRLRFIVGNAERLPFANESVDLLVSTLTLHHLSAPGPVFAEIARVLAPGGVALIYDVGLLSMTQGEADKLAASAGLEPDALTREAVHGSLGARLMVRFRLEGPLLEDDARY